MRKAHFLLFILLENLLSSFNQYFTLAIGTSRVRRKDSEFIIAQGIDAQHIILEVTESAAVTNVPYFLENLARLRMKGFHLSVDDYGVGHSSWFAPLAQCAQIV